MTESKFDDWSPEVKRMMGINRARASNDLIKVNQGQESQYGLTMDDLRCDAEQTEVDEKGVVRKSRPQKYTKPKNTTP